MKYAGRVVDLNYDDMLSVSQGIGGMGVDSQAKITLQGKEEYPITVKKTSDKKIVTNDVVIDLNEQQGQYYFYLGMPIIKVEPVASGGARRRRHRSRKAHRKSRRSTRRHR